MHKIFDPYSFNDEALIVAARSSEDETEAMRLNSVIISRYIRMIEIKANLMKSKTIDREDLVSDGFLGLLSALRTYCHDKGSFKTYAGVCVINKMKSAVIAASNAPIRAETFDLGSIAANVLPPEELVIEKEKESEIRDMLAARLSKRELQVMTLYLGACSYKQISRSLGISVKSVDNSLSRARQKLREGLRNMTQ
ncbi:MAG: sigma-70 family RNA polymerase sigma factor [Eubacterium sp.]|nr:sigma-70 family RNA polymerase sigma factor [Eubacterium sp.]